VCFASSGLRESFGGAADGRLPEDSEIPFAIGLIRDVAAIRGPDREAIVSAKRHPLHGLRAGNVVHPDVRLAAIIGSKDDSRTVR
jgi:hypothetical protein